jgi:hypothetical protein
MAILSQAYEWMNFALLGDSGAGFHIGRRPNSRPVTIPANQPVDIFTGGIGNTISTQPKVKINEFLVIEDLLCTPFKGGAVQVRINDTDYFQNPDGTPMIEGLGPNGIPGYAIPYPCGSPSGKEGDPELTDALAPTLTAIDPPIYVMPEQTWSVLFTPLRLCRGWVSMDGVGANSGCAVGVVVYYTLYTGTDSLIALKLIDMGLPVSADNAEWLKRSMIENGGYQNGD